MIDKTVFIIFMMAIKIGLSSLIIYSLYYITNSPTKEGE